MLIGWKYSPQFFFSSLSRDLDLGEGVRDVGVGIVVYLPVIAEISLVAAVRVLTAEGQCFSVHTAAAAKKQLVQSADCVSFGVFSVWFPFSIDRKDRSIRFWLQLPF